MATLLVLSQQKANTQTTFKSKQLKEDCFISIILIQYPRLIDRYCKKMKFLLRLLFCVQSIYFVNSLLVKYDVKHINSDLWNFNQSFQGKR
jgi:hypothetical protein